jgi:hypothetical protein
MWSEETIHQKFWRRLQDDRLAAMIGDPEHLRSLRYKPEIVARTQKHLRPALERRNTTLYKLIARAYGEVWDAEDEEKSRYAVERDAKKEAAIKQSDDDLVATREEGTRSGLDELQGKPEASECELEEGSGKGGIACESGKGSPEEAAPKEEGGSSGGGPRGESFYRSAGGAR